ncbi:hypothetical protein AVEN_138712-1 [Araneus ventricosus]|uniref:Uncharacterized protein n=1 Tax=Araneus ventricosus TaxID=182803 RepID=A0A4Y2GIW0_ARAVE|nr:hypothetical protein AVEN_138712-1 [Araneus ventricosus]
MLNLVILTSRFEATRGLFWDGPRHSDPRSDEEVTPVLISHLQAFTPTRGRTFADYLRFRVQRAPNTGDLQWNQVSNLELSGRKAETLLLDSNLGSVK